MAREMSTTAAAEGRAADTPAQMPARGWRQILKRTWDESRRDNLGLVAAGVAFYGFLAMAPLLASMVLIYGLVVDPADVIAHVRTLTALVPADAAGIIEEQLRNAVAAAAGKSGPGLLLALGLALFGAMKGAGAIITALNVVYEEEESRKLIRLTLVKAAVTLGALLLALCGLAATSVTAYLQQVVGATGGLSIIVQTASWIVTGLLASAFVAALYRHGPDREEARWSWLAPGSLIATLGIVLTTAGFGVYAANVGKFNATYGSLGAIVALLTWFYFSAHILLLGAELNAELEHQTARDTTTGPDKPLGRREAVMADTVA